MVSYYTECMVDTEEPFLSTSHELRAPKSKQKPHIEPNCDDIASLRN